MGKRRKKGTGSIANLPDGRKLAGIWLPDEIGEKRHFQKRFDAEGEAERWLLSLRYEAEQRAIPSEARERLVLGAYLSSWLESTVKGTVSRHTQRDYEDKVRLHIKPALGHVRLGDLTTDHITRLYRKMSSEGHAPTGVRYVHAVLSRALHDAEGRDLVRKNVARWAKPPKIEHREKPVLSVAEAMLFLEAIRGDRLEALYLLAVTTGLRRGELLGLKWDDLDLEKSTMRVSRSLDTSYGPPVENAPKRQASRRAAKLPNQVAGALERRRVAEREERDALGGNWHDSGYVFPSTKGTPHRGDNVLARGLKPLMRQAGLPPHNFQTLRRSNATFLVLLGIPPRVAMLWMGHSDVATTMRIYQQVPDELQEKAAELMEGLFFGNTRSPIDYR